MIKTMMIDFFLLEVDATLVLGVVYKNTFTVSVSPGLFKYFLEGYIKTLSLP